MCTPCVKGDPQLVSVVSGTAVFDDNGMVLPAQFTVPMWCRRVEVCLTIEQHEPILFTVLDLVLGSSSIARFGITVSQGQTMLQTITPGTIKPTPQGYGIYQSEGLAMPGTSL